MGNLQEMNEIYEELKSKKLQQHIKSFIDSDTSHRFPNALMWATINGHLDICQFLVRKDLVDVNAKNVDGENALHKAAMCNQPEIAKLLLEETSIDVNAKNNYGYTALHEAANDQRLEVTRILLKYKPRLLKNEEGETPLDIARRFGYKDIVLLLERRYNSKSY